MKGVLLLILIFLMSGVFASSVVCTIVDDKVLIEISLSEGDSVILPEEYSLFEEDGNRVSFISKEFVRSDGEWIFVLPVIVSGVYDLKVVLPSGFVLSDGLIYPKGYELGSDGRSIILEWEGVSEEVVVFYEGVKSSYGWVFILVGFLIVVGFLFFRFQRFKFVRELERLKKEARAKENASREDLLLRNLFGEEKRVLEFLIKKKRCWMKEIVRELGISKVMATRKVRSLIEKGLVKRESFGRENRISLVSS